MDLIKKYSDRAYSANDGAPSRPFNLQGWLQPAFEPNFTVCLDDVILQRGDKKNAIVVVEVGS